MDGFYDIRLYAYVPGLPGRKTDVQPTASFLFIPGVGHVDLKLVSASLFSHATDALETRPELPKQGRIADVDAEPQSAGNYPACTIPKRIELTGRRRYGRTRDGNVFGMTALAILLSQVSVNVGAHDTELVIAGIVSVVLGVLIFLVPRLLNYIVAAYLVIVGVIWLIAGL